MKIDPHQMPDLLNRLRERNDIRQPQVNRDLGLDTSWGLSQVLEPAVPIEGRIPTLKKGVYRPITEMLRYRFQFAASWKDAVLGIRFLSIREMEDVWTNAAILKHVQMRRETWPDSPLATVNLEHLSLFGLDSLEWEEVYLVWPSGEIHSSSDEPEVVEFALNDEKHFQSIGDYILFRCQ